jgi:hypothetical protein
MQLFHTAGTIQQAHSRRKLRIFQTTPISGSDGTHSFCHPYWGIVRPLFFFTYSSLPWSAVLLGTGNKVSQSQFMVQCPLCQRHSLFGILGTRAMFLARTRLAKTTICQIGEIVTICQICYYFFFQKYEVKTKFIQSKTDRPKS